MLQKGLAPQPVEICSTEDISSRIGHSDTVLTRKVKTIIINLPVKNRLIQQAVELAFFSSVIFGLTGNVS